MELTEWLLEAAQLHYAAKNKFEDVMYERYDESESSERLRCKIDFTKCDDEFELNDLVVNSIGHKPKAIKGLSSSAVLAMAYLFEAAIGGDNDVKGREVVQKLKVKVKYSIKYLKALGELQERGWLNLILDEYSEFMTQPPYCWLHAKLGIGGAFQEAVCGLNVKPTGFNGNDDYLDSIFKLIGLLTSRGSIGSRFRDTFSDSGNAEQDYMLRNIENRAKTSTCDIPAFSVKKKYGLSLYQHITILGMYAQDEGEVDYDFSDPRDVVKLFSNSPHRARRKLREHLYESESTLIRHKLIESREGDFGTIFFLSLAGRMALTGQKTKEITIIENLKKSTIFDIETPRIKPGVVMLPPSVEQAIDTILYSETPAGRKLRKEWYKSLPSEWGAPTGTTILLYGPAGTGKTLTAQYLASRLKRPLFKVDASQILSMWVGQSEKRVREIFDQYMEVQGILKMSPVLLFNEADQLLGARGRGEHSVDKMYNNMQNLFLEGLERFSGILVATTNRRDLLDAAFSRRFTYKLELPVPDLKLRRAIWEQHLPLERLELGANLDIVAELGLTGGEIRLVVEKAIRQAAFIGKKNIDLDWLLSLAKEEQQAKFNREGLSRKIGF